MEDGDLVMHSLDLSDKITKNGQRSLAKFIRELKLSSGIPIRYFEDIEEYDVK